MAKKFYLLAMRTSETEGYVVAAMTREKRTKWIRGLKAKKWVIEAITYDAVLVEGTRKQVFCRREGAKDEGPAFRAAQRGYFRVL